MKLRTQMEMSAAVIGAILTLMVVSGIPTLTFAQGLGLVLLGTFFASGLLEVTEWFTGILSRADQYDLTQKCHGQLRSIREGLAAWTQNERRQAAHQTIPDRLAGIREQLAAAERAMIEFPYSLGRAIAEIDRALWGLDICQELWAGRP